MFDTLKALISQNKKVVGLLAVSILAIGFGGYAIYDGVTNTVSETDVKQAKKENEKGGKEAAKQFKQVANMDLPSKEEVSSFIGNYKASESVTEAVDNEYGKETYFYYVLNLLPSTNDSDKVLMVKSGNIKYAKDQEKDTEYKHVVKQDMLPIPSGNNEYNYSSTYTTSTIGFKEYEDKFSYGYAEGGVEVDMLTGLGKYPKDKSRTNFRVSLIVYPHENMSLETLQKEVNKMPIVVEGTAMQPFLSYFREILDDKGVPYAEDFKKEGVPDDFQSYTNFEANDGVPFSDKKVIAGVGYKFDFIGNVNTFFEDLGSILDNSVSVYEFDSLPASIDMKIDDNKITLKKVDKESLNKISKVEIQP